MVPSGISAHSAPLPIHSGKHSRNDIINIINKQTNKKSQPTSLVSHPFRDIYNPVQKYGKNCAS